MGLFSQLAGTLSSFFQIGGPGGAGWNDVGATAIEAKDPTNTTLIAVRAATPVGRHDVTTKTYTDTAANHPLPGTIAFNGAGALPANSATEQWYVVTTTGVNASVGQLLWDDGSGVGTVTVIPAVTGNTVVTVGALAGATPLAATSLYVWNGATWVLISANSPTPAGVVSMIRLPIATATPVTSATILPVGAIVDWACVDVTTAYPAGTTINVGTATTATQFQNGGGANPDNVPSAVNLYEKTQDTAITAAQGPSAVVIAISGAPATGAGFVLVRYTGSPNS